MRRIAVAVVAFALAFVAIPATSASAEETGTSSVAADQTFAGEVNGSYTGATLKVKCPAPQYPGQLGSPDTRAYVSIAPDIAIPTILAPGEEPIQLGDTGTEGTQINVYLDGTSAPDGSLQYLTTFTSYDQIYHLSSDLLLPCSGEGKVVFEPWPASEYGESMSVPVTFFGSTR
jgi:hypothetical protein